MSKIVKSVISFVAVAVMVFLGLWYFSDLTELKESKEKYSEFYEVEDDVDVLFLGSSHVLNGIFPMELWNDYGIVSYNMAGYGNTQAMNYWILKNALEYTTPELVVFDACMLASDEKIGTLEQLHMSVDHIPYSKTKVEMIHDLVEEEDRRSDFLWKFSTYHNRWNELEEKDFTRGTTPEKGAQSLVGVAVPAELRTFESDFKSPEDSSLGLEYACKIIEECQEAGIEVLVTYLPFPDDSGWQGESNRMKDIAKEYGVNFLDFHTLLEQVNMNTDFFDENSHMNPSGARKVTSYIGNYIMQNYAIEDQRENETYSSWHDDYETYTEFKKENIRKAEELKDYLMLLNDKSFSYGIYFKAFNRIASYPVLVELLENMGIHYSEIPNEDLFLLIDQVGEERKELRLFETMESKFAEFSMFYNDAGHLELTNSSAESMTITYADIAVIVFDNSDLSFVDQAKFVLEDVSVEFMENKE